MNALSVPRKCNLANWLLKAKDIFRKWLQIMQLQEKCEVFAGCLEM